MSVYQIDPLHDPRWAQLVQNHPRATVFHTPGWLEALRRTHGYECFGLTTSKPNDELKNGLVLCRVRSWLTGSRWVSVPFADHCDPLIDDTEDCHLILDWVAKESARMGNDYVEIRPLNGSLFADDDTLFRKCEQFRIHLLDLGPSFEDLLRSFDKHSVQRRIRKIVRDGLVHEVGTSPALLKKFYHLMVLTRRRHRVPPQPLSWYSNLLDAMKDKAQIRVVSRSGIPVASILTIRHGATMVYKYGCSDARYNKFAGNVYLFWHAIREAKKSGATVFDMGRTDLGNSGLINFKSHWGTVDFPLTYWRFPGLSRARRTGRFELQKIGGYLLSSLPDRCLVAIGTLLYRHAG